MTSYDLLALGKGHTNMIINKDPLLTRIFYWSGPGKIYQMIHSIDFLIQDLFPAIFKLSDFVPKGLLRIFKDPWVPPFEDSPAFITLGILSLRIVPQHYPENQSCESFLNLISHFFPTASSPETLITSPLVLLLIPWKELRQESTVGAFLSNYPSPCQLPWAL